MKSENLNFLEVSGPFQACNETALPFLYICTQNLPRVKLGVHIYKKVKIISLYPRHQTTPGEQRNRSQYCLKSLSGIYRYGTAV